MGQICYFLWTSQNKKLSASRGLRPLTHQGLCEASDAQSQSDVINTATK